MKVLKRQAKKAEPLVPVSKVGTPFWPMRQLQSEIDRLFEDPFVGWLTPDGPFVEAGMPAVDVFEEKDNVVVKAELPGLKKEEFRVYIMGENLNLTGERNVETEEKTAETYRSERYFGHFHRSIPLPAPVDSGKVEAHYKDGVLTITCPKTEEAKRKEVEVKVD